MEYVGYIIYFGISSYSSEKYLENWCLPCQGLDLIQYSYKRVQETYAVDIC